MKIEQNQNRTQHHEKPESVVRLRPQISLFLHTGGSLFDFSGIISILEAQPLAEEHMDEPDCDRRCWSYSAPLANF